MVFLNLHKRGVRCTGSFEMASNLSTHPGILYLVQECIKKKTNKSIMVGGVFLTLGLHIYQHA